MPNPDPDQEFVVFADDQVAPIVAVDSGIIDYLAGAPIGFTDTWFETICVAAASLPRDGRDAFLRNIASGLSACPTDAEVREAVAAAMG
jgi:hypothetical protein